MALNDVPPFGAREEHDLLNPVASIAGCAQTLLTWGDRIEPSVREDLARIILRQAQQLEAQIRARTAPSGRHPSDVPTRMGSGEVGWAS